MTTDTPAIEGIDLTEEQVQLLSETEALGAQVSAHIEKLRASGADMRWMAIATTHMQEGGMALARAICKPKSFF